jgi:spectinomycin phosphotransferase
VLEKPAISDESIVARLRSDYGLSIAQLSFLPLGFDLNSAVFRAVAGDGAAYFVKLRRAAFDPICVTLPRLLSDRGVRQIIAPLPTQLGQLWANVNDFTLIVYPFVDGRTAREMPLSERQWRDFGAAMKSLHAAPLPATITESLRRVTYSSKWRDSVRMFLARIADEALVDPIAIRLAAVVTAHRTQIIDLVARADALTHTLMRRTEPMVVCHTDIHASNLLIGADGAVYIVDWDDPMLAPKERDLMFPGGGQGFLGYSADQEETLFYRGYGDTSVDRDALRYFRCERILEDIALACEQLLSPDGGSADRELTLHYLGANFLPGGTIEAAQRGTTWQIAPF